MAVVTQYANMRLTPAQAETLDALAGLLGVNRSEAVRRLLSLPLTTLAIATVSTDAKKEAAGLLTADRTAARATTDKRNLSDANQKCSTN